MGLETDYKKNNTNEKDEQQKKKKVKLNQPDF